MPATPHAFTDEEALACLRAQMPTEAQVQFVANLMCRNVWQGPLTADHLCRLWGISSDMLHVIRGRARSIRFAAIQHVDEDLRNETLSTLIHVRDEAMKSYEAMMAQDRVREAQKFLETAKGAAASLATLLPKQEGSGDATVELIVNLGSGERPKKEAG